MQRVAWRVEGQPHQLPHIPSLDEVGTLPLVFGNKLGWLIGEGVLGERHAFEPKLMVEMDAMPSEGRNVKMCAHCIGVEWSEAIDDCRQGEASGVFGIRSKLR